MSDLFGTGGQHLLDELRLPAAYAGRIASLRRLIDAFDFEIHLYGRMLDALGAHPGYIAVQAIDGVGPPSPRSSSRRSATCTALAARRRCARGPG